jgi:hypothetical protein
VKSPSIGCCRLAWYIILAPACSSSHRLASSCLHPVIISMPGCSIHIKNYGIYIQGCRIRGRNNGICMQGCWTHIESLGICIQDVGFMVKAMAFASAFLKRVTYLCICNYTFCFHKSWHHAAPAVTGVEKNVLEGASSWHHPAFAVG